MLSPIITNLVDTQERIKSEEEDVQAASFVVDGRGVLLVHLLKKELHQCLPVFLHVTGVAGGSSTLTTLGDCYSPSNQLPAQEHVLYGPETYRLIQTMSWILLTLLHLPLVLRHVVIPRWRALHLEKQFVWVSLCCEFGTPFFNWGSQLTAATMSDFLLCFSQLHLRTVIVYNRKFPILLGLSMTHTCTIKTSGRN